METFGRGCLYIIIGIAVLSFLAIITQSHINISLIIAIPLIVLAFWAANKKTIHDDGDGGGSGHSNDDEEEGEGDEDE